MANQCKAADLKAQELPDRPLSQIVINVLPNGRVCLSSTCQGRFDSSYAPFHDQRAPQEVQRLLGELRERLKQWD